MSHSTLGASTWVFRHLLVSVCLSFFAHAQRIGVKPIEDVLKRGVVVDGEDLVLALRYHLLSDHPPLWMFVSLFACSTLLTTALPPNAPPADSYNDLMQRKTGGGAPAQSTLQRVNEELLDVQRIMGKNIEQVLDRGETLDGEPYSSLRHCWLLCQLASFNITFTQSPWTTLRCLSYATNLVLGCILFVHMMAPSGRSCSTAYSHSSLL